MGSALDAARGVGIWISERLERWVPDAWVICMALTALALVLSVGGAGASPEEAVLAWGGGVWTLLSLAMQFTISLVAAGACVASRPAYRLFDRLASLPNPDRPRQAVLLAGIFSMTTGLVNAAICTVACALFVPFVCRRNPQADVRVIIAAAYLGLGTVWAAGLSSSAPLIMATPGNPLIAPASGPPIVDRLYPITETLFQPFNYIYISVIAVAALTTLLVLHPTRDVRTLSPETIDKILPEPPAPEPPPETPAQRIEHFRGWVWLAAFLLAYPLGHSMWTRGFGATWTINAYNAVFLTLALLLHGRALPFLRACREAVDSAWGLILQFPFYAGIFGLMQQTALGPWLGHWFASFATADSFAFVVYIYSGVMNLFVPSAGSKWLIEAPYLLPVARELGVSPTTVLLAYAYGDSTTNLIQPMWAIPMLTVARMRFGDVVGYTLLVAAVCFLVSSVAMFLLPTDL